MYGATIWREFFDRTIVALVQFGQGNCTLPTSFAISLFDALSIFIPCGNTRRFIKLGVALVFACGLEQS